MIDGLLNLDWAGVGLAAIASGCTALSSLDLTDCLQLRDQDIRSFAWAASEGVLRRFPDAKRDAELLMQRLWGGGTRFHVDPRVPHATDVLLVVMRSWAIHCVVYCCVRLAPTLLWRLQLGTLWVPRCALPVLA